MASQMPDPELNGLGVVLGGVVIALAVIGGGLAWACYVAFSHWQIFGWLVGSVMLAIGSLLLAAFGSYLICYSWSDFWKEWGYKEDND